MSKYKKKDVIENLKVKVMKKGETTQRPIKTKI
jgi:hypothetical protein